MRGRGLRQGAAALAAALALMLAGGAWAQTSDLVVRSELRVCADPANLPFSNDKGEGFENKLADLLGKALNVPVTYFWFPQATGFIRNTLGAKACDIVMGYAQGDELVLNTNHYYASAYALITRADSELASVETLSDPRLQGKKIGVVAGTPPATNLAINGLMGNVRPFQLMVDRRFFSPARDMVSQIASKELDAGILWGPIGGYYAKQSSEPLKVTPLMKETQGPHMAFRITMGVRQSDGEWKRQLNRLIREHQSEINAILQSYGVPLVETD
ncbi:substrate-binding domain-containing protein [Rhodomicrobium vannielii]|uniref:substrate-binding domain-containing protein n=1 Tax=Rhodomicrobium vannielii TaxID=1069 RepID=UPI003D7C2E6B